MPSRENSLMDLKEVSEKATPLLDEKKNKTLLMSPEKKTLNLNSIQNNNVSNNKINYDRGMKYPIRQAPSNLRYALK